MCATPPPQSDSTKLVKGGKDCPGGTREPPGQYAHSGHWAGPPRKSRSVPNSRKSPGRGAKGNVTGASGHEGSLGRIGLSIYRGMGDEHRPDKARGMGDVGNRETEAGTAACHRQGKELQNASIYEGAVRSPDLLQGVCPLLSHPSNP